MSRNSIITKCSRYIFRKSWINITNYINSINKRPTVVDHYATISIIISVSFISGIWQTYHYKLSMYLEWRLQHPSNSNEGGIVKRTSMFNYSFDLGFTTTATDLGICIISPLSSAICLKRVANSNHFQIKNLFLLKLENESRGTRTSL